MTPRLARFLAVGAVGAVVNLGTLALLVAAGLNKYLASPIAIEASILSNFVLHQRWTFADRPRADSLWVRGLKFKSVAMLALLASYAAFVLLCRVVPDIPPTVAQAIAILPGTAVNYLCNSRWTFPETR
ncbi:MAG TPA: GtrA family protein [Thermodesulfobacteriota bacterium]